MQAARVMKSSKPMAKPMAKESSPVETDMKNPDKSGNRDAKPLGSSLEPTGSLFQAAETAPTGQAGQAGPSNANKKEAERALEVEKSNATIIHQLFQLLPRDSFSKIVKKHNPEGVIYKFSPWTHLVLMILAQLSNASSLRELVGVISSTSNRIIQLEIDKVPAISTISYANKTRDWRLFKDVFEELFKRINYRLYKLNKTSLKKDYDFPFYSIDSTTVSLCLKTFDWALYRRRKGGIKLHLFLDNQFHLPCFVLVTPAKESDIKTANKITASEETDKPTIFDEANARAIALPKGSMVAMDRGYVDYALFHRWTKEGISFVIKPKISMAYQVTEECPLPEGGLPTIRDVKTQDEYRVIRDCHIKFTGSKAKESCPVELRMVTIRCDATNDEMSVLTNNMELPADVISRLYKERWEIESFFRLIKQNLIIKSFLGTTVNAVNCQIWAAMIAILLIKYLQIISNISWSFSTLIYLIRMHLFSYLKLYVFINVPHCEKPPKPPPKKGEKRRQLCRSLF
jgi:hypothetical protein